MNSHFFLICIGVLGCYAVWRTLRRGWLRMLMGLFLALCLVKIGTDALFPEPVAVAQAAVPTPTVSLAGARNLINEIKDDRCVISHLQDTPLGPIAYMLQFRQFMESYTKAQSSVVPGSGVNLGAVSQAVSATFGPEDETAKKPGLCDKFESWLQAQAQIVTQNNTAGVASEPQ